MCPRQSASCAPNANPACRAYPRPLQVSSANPRSQCAPFPNGSRTAPALWKWNGRAHCGEHLDGRFLYTLTLTDLATGWTECLPLLSKSADAVLAALAQARKLFPFPLLGIDTDSGSEFLNEELIAYCEQEQLTFTRGRPGIKNDQCHVEQKNGAVVRGAVGCARLVGVQAYHQLREVYRALRLVVNC
ncbi:MAG: transposase family protein [Chloroflexi bacterium]|nr:MAG: transposase family protein [Chloroflexota bacterium]